MNRILVVEDDKMTDRIEDTVKDMMLNNLQKAEAALEEFDEALSNGRYEDAIQSLKVANQLYQASSDITEDIDEKGAKIEEIQSKIEENDNQERQDELNNKMGIGATYSDDEILLNDLKNIRDSIKEGITRDKETYERCR